MKAANTELFSSPGLASNYMTGFFFSLCYTGSHGQPKLMYPKTLKMISLPPLCHMLQSRSLLLGLVTMSSMATGAKACVTQPRKMSFRSWLGQHCLLFHPQT